MSQRIDGPTTSTVADLYRATSRSAAGASPKPVAATAATDTVRLTGDALSLHQLDKTLAGIPAIDHGRVAAIKQALTEGRYTLDPAAIADRLGHFEWQLGT